MKRQRIVLLIIVLCMTAWATTAQASHFRFGIVSWVQRADISATSAQFDVQHAWRRTACPGTAGDGRVAVGDPACGFATFFFGDGGSVALTGTVVSIDVGNDWYLATYTATHTYPAVNNGGTPWSAGFSSCCRIYAPQVNAPGTSFAVRTDVDLALVNSSPVSTIFPIVQMAVNQVNVIAPPLADFDSDTLTCRLATFAESGNGIFNQPAAGFPLSISPSCIITWNTAGTAVGQLWATQIIIEESRGGNPPHGQIALEFLIEIVQAICPGPPQCDSPPTPTGTITVPVGTPYSATIQGSTTCPAPNDGLSLNTTGIPAGATLAPPLPTSNPGSVSSVLNWTPTSADTGPHPLLFSVTGSDGQQALCPFVLDVPTNQQCVPICQDVTVDNDPGQCSANVSVDNGSFDPDGDPFTLTQDPASPYPVGTTSVDLTCDDGSGQPLEPTATCTVIVVDAEPPAALCNAPTTITPPDAPIAFTGGASDNCGADIEITGFDCFMFTQKGKRIDKTESCQISIDGDKITILDSGGVGDHISWTVVATDAAGNQSSTECELLVENPGQGGMHGRF